MANQGARRTHLPRGFSRYRIGGMVAIAVSTGFMPSTDVVLASGIPHFVAGTSRIADGDKGYETDGPGSSCTASADTLFHACRQRVNDDFFSAQAICINAAKSQEREKCFAEARTKRVEGRQLCHVQLASRRSACVGLGDDRYPEVDGQTGRPTSTSCRIPTPKICLRLATDEALHFTGSFDRGWDLC